ncbi:endonuclease/exonuclease/phosphatase family protein [Spirillospora sp. NPDC047279]|uniref:endonuclease/exonuclease/phosphatase family protein n=1 Tax=Spirillospora sp. NPDC047279 TaxID=3155478 RepID=UPI00340325E1
MRAPRALIPLLAVAAATAVVVTAGAGAAIQRGPASAPALADPAPVPAATVSVLNWNVCGNNYSHCPLGAEPAELVQRIASHMKGGAVAGRPFKANAIFLQEVCAGQVKTLARAAALRSWSWAFAPAREADGKPVACGNGQGQFGVALGAQQRLSGVQKVNLPSPAFEGRVAVCGDVAAWKTRLCTTHLSSRLTGDDTTGAWRLKQTRQLATMAGTGRVVVGGDFNDQPQKPSLDGLYAAYTECDQGPGGARAGENTTQDTRGRTTEKIDYVFATKTARIACEVPGQPVRASDHRPVAAVVTLP